MASGVPVVRDGQLGTTVRKIGHSNFLGTLLQNVIQAAELDRRKIFTIRIAGPVLDRARHPHHSLDAAVVGSNLLVGDGPVDIKTIQAGCPEVNAPKTSR